MDTLVLFLILGGMLQFLTIENNVFYRLIIYGLYYVEVGSFYAHFLKSFNPQWWKTESIPPKIRNKTRVSTFTTIIQHSYTNQRRKRNKRNPDWKRSKALTADDMLLYIENPKDSIRKLVELISEFSRVARYKIST